MLQIAVVNGLLFVQSCPTAPLSPGPNFNYSLCVQHQMAVNQTQDKEFSHFRFLRAEPHDDKMSNRGLVDPLRVCYQRTNNVLRETDSCELPRPIASPLLKL